MSEVRVETEGNIRKIILNRPEAMNSITPGMLAQLNDEIKSADEDVGVRVIILTGEGRAFCAGLDLKQAASGEGISGALSVPLRYHFVPSGVLIIQSQCHVRLRSRIPIGFP